MLLQYSSQRVANCLSSMTEKMRAPIDQDTGRDRKAQDGKRFKLWCKVRMPYHIHNLHELDQTNSVLLSTGSQIELAHMTVPGTSERMATCDTPIQRVVRNWRGVSIEACTCISCACQSGLPLVCGCRWQHRASSRV